MELPESSRSLQLASRSPGDGDSGGQALPEDLDQVGALLVLLRTGRLRASVEHVVDLDHVARAHQLAETEGRGKVVVDLTRS